MEKYMSKRTILICIFVLLIISLIGIVIIGGDKRVADNGVDPEDLRGYAEKLADVGNYENAGRLYDEIALHYENKSDWEGSSRYYLLAAGNFTEAERYESAGASYLKAGNCFYEMRDCNNASKYYLSGAESYKRCNPDYDDTWIEGKLKRCNEKSLMGGLVIFGILLGMLKFASKAAFGLGFATVGKKEIAAITTIYFVIPLLMSGLIGLMRGTLYEFIDRLFNFGIAFGAFQLTVALLLLTLGLYTIRKWKDKRDISRRTFLLMALPCPVSLATMFMTCAFFIITGMDVVKVGLLVGSIFVLSILGMTFVIRRSGFEKRPSNLGTVMIFFGMLYLLSIVLMPAYLPVHDMNIGIEGFSTEDMTTGFLFAAIMVLIGFVIERIKNRRIEWNCSRN